MMVLCAWSKHFLTTFNITGDVRFEILFMHLNNTSKYYERLLIKHLPVQSQL